MKRKRVGPRVAATRTSTSIGVVAAFCMCAGSDLPHVDSFQHFNSVAITTQRRRPTCSRLRPCLLLMMNERFSPPSASSTTMTTTTDTEKQTEEQTKPQFVICTPTRLQDYEDVGRLLCEAFEGGQSSLQKQQGGSGGNAVSDLLWNIGITRALAAAQYTNRYVSNARQMRGKKYALFVAKSFGTTANSIACIDGEADNNNSTFAGKGIKPGQVIAMAEVGVSKYRILQEESVRYSGVNPRDETDVIASVGVICVAESQRRSGAASELLKSAESVARRRWNETSLHAAVEPSNVGALRFFLSKGYEDSGLVVEVEVSERMKGEMRPHILLRRKFLTADTTGTGTT